MTTTPRENMILRWRAQPSGLVPHMELVFYLTMEAFGKVHPTARRFGQWDQMSEKERQLHRRDVAELYVATARRYKQRIFFHPPEGVHEEDVAIMLDSIRRSRACITSTLYADLTFGIPRRRHEEFLVPHRRRAEEAARPSAGRLNGETWSGSPDGPTQGPGRRGGHVQR